MLHRNDLDVIKTLTPHGDGGLESCSYVFSLLSKVFSFEQVYCVEGERSKRVFTETLQFLFHFLRLKKTKKCDVIRVNILNEDSLPFSRLRLV